MFHLLIYIGPPSLPVKTRVHKQLVVCCVVEQAGEAEGRKTENFGHHGILFGFLCLIVTYRNVTKIRRQVWTETVVVMATPWQ